MNDWNEDDFIACDKCILAEFVLGNRSDNLNVWPLSIALESPCELGSAVATLPGSQASTHPRTGRVLSSAMGAVNEMRRYPYR